MSPEELLYAIFGEDPQFVWGCDETCSDDCMADHQGEE